MSVERQKRNFPTNSARNMVEAVVLLRPLASGQPPSPAQSRQMIDSVLQGAIEATGLRPDSSATFENMNSFSVRADRQFVDAIARADEVQQVLPNEVQETGLIEPVKVEPFKLTR